MCKRIEAFMNATTTEANAMIRSSGQPLTRRNPFRKLTKQDTIKASAPIVKHAEKQVRPLCASCSFTLS
jgi:hypothetical protein